MKISLIPAFAALLLVNNVSAFSPMPSSMALRLASRNTLGMAVELEPEPEGGEEVSSVDDSLAGSRVKNMGEVDGVSSEDGTVYKFWLTAEADGAKIKEYRTTILKDAAKKANFPGFRKGQVPPYAQPQITGFAVQEGLIKTVESAVSAYGLKALPGSDGEVTVNEEVVQLKAFLLIFLLVEDTGMEFWDLENLNISDLPVNTSIQNAFGGLAVHAIIGAMKYHCNVPDICGPACTALACLSFGNASNQEFVVHTDGIDLILSAMQRFKSVLEVQECALVALLSLADSIQTKLTIADEGGISTTVAAMKEFETSSCIQEKACVLLRNLALNCKKNKESNYFLKAIRTIISAMERHKDVAIVQEEACHFLWALAFDCPRNREEIVSYNGDNRVREAIRLHGWDKSVRFIAKNTLYTLIEPEQDGAFSTPGCNPEDMLIQYRKIFDEIDVNSNGLIEFDELRRAFKVLGMLENQFNTISLFLEADQDCSGNIDFDEFLWILKNNSTHCLQEIVTNPKRALCRLKIAFRESELEFLQKNITFLTDNAIDEVLFYTSDHVISVVSERFDCDVDRCRFAFNKLVWQKDHARFFAEFICNLKETTGSAARDDGRNMKEVIDQITDRFLVITHRYCHYNALFGDPIKSKEGARQFRFSVMLAACYSEFFEDAEASFHRETDSQKSISSHEEPTECNIGKGMIGSLLTFFE